jgi:hypothetical protein
MMSTLLVAAKPDKEDALRENRIVLRGCIKRWACRFRPPPVMSEPSAIAGRVR